MKELGLEEILRVTWAKGPRGGKKEESTRTPCGGAWQVREAKRKKARMDLEGED